MRRTPTAFIRAWSSAAGMAKSPQSPPAAWCPFRRTTSAHTTTMTSRLLSPATMQNQSTVVNQMRFGSSRHKVVTVEDAVHLIQSGSTITVCGFVAQNSPEEVLKALGDRFRETGEPKDLTLVFTGGPGDWATKGLNHLAQHGMLKRTIGAHYGQTPMIGKMAQENEIEAYNLPMGTISRMIRAAASKSPGHLTKIGYGTFCDPAISGGKINEKTTEDIVSEVEVLGEKYLMYKALPIDVAIVRGTTADPDGNVTMERESLYVDNMIQAMSARSRRGIVIAQVERLAANGSLNPRNVRIPGTMVDCVVVAKPENHTMSYFTENNPAATAAIRAAPDLSVLPLDERKVIARRAALEITPNQVVNLGIGMPEGVAAVASEEGVLRNFELTTEPGVHGGVGLTGHDFGPAVNYDALLEMNQQFDFYNGGGLDVCFLGMAEVDQAGNVNVTRVGNKLTGPGGFVDISQSTKRVNLLGTMTAGGAKYKIENGKISIDKEGRNKKFVKNVKEITFSGTTAMKNKQLVKFITERAVFTFTKTNGMELAEIAPGIDLRRDILDQMDFEPYVRPNLKTMDATIFKPDLMKLAETGFGLDMDERLHCNKKTKTVYINLNNLSVTQAKQIDELREAIGEYIVANFGTNRVHAIINYEGFDCRNELNPQFRGLAKHLEDKYYLTVRRYTNHRTFTRHKLATMIGVEEMAGELGESVSFADAKHTIKTLGLMVSQSAFENYWAALDKENVGRISKDQFAKMLNQLRKSTRSQ